MPSDQPASEKQCSAMAELGLPVSASCTSGQATEMIGLARIVLRYVSQIANRNWRIPVEDSQLLPIVQAVMATGKLAEQIRENMDASAQAAWTAVNDFEKDPNASGPRAKIERRDVVPDVKEDACYFFVKMQLEKRFPKLAERLNEPAPVQTVSNEPRIFLAQETRWERLKRRWTTITSRRAH